MGGSEAFVVLEYLGSLLEILCSVLFLLCVVFLVSMNLFSSNAGPYVIRTAPKRVKRRR